jgi:hypothetical protein
MRPPKRPPTPEAPDPQPSKKVGIYVDIKKVLSHNAGSLMKVAVTCYQDGYKNRLIN